MSTQRQKTPEELRREQRERNRPWRPGNLDYARPRRITSGIPTGRKIKPSITDAEIRKIQRDLAKEAISR